MLLKEIPNLHFFKESIKMAHSSICQLSNECEYLDYSPPKWFLSRQHGASPLMLMRIPYCKTLTTSPKTYSSDFIHSLNKLLI